MLLVAERHATLATVVLVVVVVVMVVLGSLRARCEMLGTVTEKTTPSSPPRSPSASPPSCSSEVIADGTEAAACVVCSGSLGALEDGDCFGGWLVAHDGNNDNDKSGTRTGVAPLPGGDGLLMPKIMASSSDELYCDSVSDGVNRTEDDTGGDREELDRLRCSAAITLGFRHSTDDTRSHTTERSISPRSTCALAGTFCSA
uniref:Putative secreted protein n=1 Tax=Anopheles darlingi TaxID=43151 RepID=A0A2M4D7Y3_ANODA